MVLHENERFLTELGKLFQKSRTGGPSAVTMTMKRYDGRTKPEPRDGSSPVPPHTDLKCLVRAKCGGQAISTVINSKDVNKFHLAYASLLKSNMDSLKKRDKKKEAAKTSKRNVAAT